MAKLYGLSLTPESCVAGDMKIPLFYLSVQLI